jgi:hypothetical protein
VFGLILFWPAFEAHCITVLVYESLVGIWPTKLHFLFSCGYMTYHTSRVWISCGYLSYHTSLFVLLWVFDLPHFTFCSLVGIWPTTLHFLFSCEYITYQTSRVWISCGYKTYQTSLFVLLWEYDLPNFTFLDHVRVYDLQNSLHVSRLLESKQPTKLNVTFCFWIPCEYTTYQNLVSSTPVSALLY